MTEGPNLNHVIPAIKATDKNSRGGRKEEEGIKSGLINDFKSKHNHFKRISL